MLCSETGASGTIAMPLRRIVDGGTTTARDSDAIRLCGSGAPESSRDRCSPDHPAQSSAICRFASAICPTFSRSFTHDDDRRRE